MLVELDLLKPCSEAWAAEGREPDQSNSQTTFTQPRFQL